MAYMSMTPEADSLVLLRDSGFRRLRSLGGGEAEHGAGDSVAALLSLQPGGSAEREEPARKRIMAKSEDRPTEVRALPPWHFPGSPSAGTNLLAHACGACSKCKPRRAISTALKGAKGCYNKRQSACWRQKSRPKGEQDWLLGAGTNLSECIIKRKASLWMCFQKLLSALHEPSALSRRRKDLVFAAKQLSKWNARTRKEHDAKLLTTRPQERRRRGEGSRQPTLALPHCSRGTRAPPQGQAARSEDPSSGLQRRGVCSPCPVGFREVRTLRVAPQRESRPVGVQARLCPWTLGPRGEPAGPRAEGRPAGPSRLRGHHRPAGGFPGRLQRRGRSAPAHPRAPRPS
ncbi:PREDICTED: uncharacterized protein LOC106146571, partial [Chinchilla lanigera]|uniref:uncharacterized protein LOC106146571 n=1 Tax=Chinchilla lanigera TaxID=34839 RepID=UPI000698CEDE